MNLLTESCIAHVGRCVGLSRDFELATGFVKAKWPIVMTIHFPLRGGSGTAGRFGRAC
jgi:hypothetical protein